jgi:uncharacterized protein (TIGR02145 family)
VQYEFANSFCYNNTSIEDRCGSNEYDLATQFCNNRTVVDKCGGILEYDPATEQCCGSSKYNPTTQFCTRSEAHPEVVELCGGKGYDTKKKMCHFDMAKDFFIDTRDREVYPYVQIGTQTWMAKNLNYNANGSKCYAEGVSGVSSDSIAKNCATYGRLYDWATAMGFEAACNSSSCAGQIKTPHKGICPEGWHISNNAEWDVLYRYADGTSNPSISPNVDKYFKATRGWNSGDNGEDTYGFSSLPGGVRSPDGIFRNAGDIGGWWNSNELNGDNPYYAYYWIMGMNFNNYRYDEKNFILHSVRCVKDGD